MSHQPTKQELFTLRVLADQAQDSNMDPAQVLHHLQASYEVVQNSQQQVRALQNIVNEQASAPQANPQGTLEALLNATRDQQQLNQSANARIQQVLERLALRQSSTSRRAPVLVLLTTKFKADDDEMTFLEFKAKLSSVFARFPDSFPTDTDNINYGL
ncbi:hypothetical protein EDD11_004493 [Mortierella claussenii]|nr:hypothetical protein EDD11_004493 [Mortierella claussenii]